MFQNAAIDIAIGLVLMYLVLSLVCTVINEFIATILRIRANSLADTLGQLLDDPSLRQAFYSHGLIVGTRKAVDKDHPSYLSGRTFALALLGSLDRSKPLPHYADLKAAVENLDRNSSIRDVLLANLTAANGTFNDLREHISTWFDDAMDRSSARYKRTMKYMSLVIGLFIAVLMNADTLAVGRALWMDPDLRQQMAQVANSAIQRGAPQGSSQDRQPSDVVNAFKSATETLRPLPVGWNFNGTTNIISAPNSVPGWIEKFIGWLVTAFALSLGAPFWFDTLSKFMKVRGTGDKPPREDKRHAS